MSKRAIILIYLIIIIGIMSCSEEKNPVATGKDPVISEVKLQNNWNTKASSIYKTEVFVNDPQGPGNLAGVTLSVHERDGNALIYSDSLYDDGSYYFPQSGDVLAGDGVYSNRFRALDISRNSDQTEFIFRFLASDEENNQSQIWEENVFFAANSPPEIQQIVAPDSFSFEGVNTIFSITVSDSNGLDDIASAYFESENIAKNFSQFEQDLYNDGDFENHGDEVAGDSIFSARITTDFLVAKKGEYKLIFHVEDLKGEENVEEASQLIYVNNFASQLLNIDIPTSITIPGGSDINRELMKVEVADSESLADIDSVYFYSLKPDSNLANNGEPFIMVDNGLSYNPGNPLVETGDEVAGDGVYALSLLVNSSNLPGIYTFSFYIRDRAGNLTGPVKRTIELLQ
jgi:hypothetical protein